MRFLVYGEPWRWGMPGSLHAALREQGHETVFFDFTRYLFGQRVHGKTGVALDRLLFRRVAGNVNHALRTCLMENNFDGVIICKGEHVWPETVRLARKRSTWVINWNFDEFFNPAHCASHTEQAFREYNLILTPRRHLIKDYYARGAQNVSYVKFCFDPLIHYPVVVRDTERMTFTCDVVFVGTWSRRREEILSHLKMCSVKIWGGSWHHSRRKFRSLKNIEVTGRLAEGENMSRAFHGASICLNILTLENSDRTNVRNLEIAACGGFQLCERTDEVLELFEEHKEMACYEKIDELIDKCQYYLARPSERQQVAAAGHKRVMAGGHTYADRVHEILVLLKEL